MIAAVLAVASKNMVVDLDLFHEMALARQIEQDGSMPTIDSFAYTPTIEPVVHHEWLTGVFLYWLCVKLGFGATGLVVTKYFLTAAVAGGCFWYGRRNNVPIYVFAALAPIALLVGGWMAFTNIRAQLFTLFFLVSTFLLLDVDRRGGRWWIAVWLPLVVVWGNFHGGVVSGIGIIGCYGVAKTLESWLATRSIAKTLLAVRYLVITGIATAALMNVSPYGMDYVPYLLRAIRMPRPLISEWDPIWQTKAPSVLILYVMSVSLAGLAVYFHWFGNKQNENDDSQSKLAWQAKLFGPFAIALTAYLAFKHQRHGSLYAVTWICVVPPMLVGSIVADQLCEMWSKYSRLITVTATAFSIVAVGFAINQRFWRLQVPAQTAKIERNHMLYPVGPVDYLEQIDFQGNLMAPFNYASYVSWKSPAVKVSIDSRYEVAYPHGAVEESVSFYNGGDGWQQRLTKYATDSILVPRLAPLTDHMQELEELGWQLRYRDQSFLLFFPTHAAESLPEVDRSADAIVGVFP
jgi:hypothetical protein